MADISSSELVGTALYDAIVALLRRVRQMKADQGGLTDAESSALSRLQQDGPATSSEVARRQQISPQSMGATFAALEERGLVTRSADPNDGRRILLSASSAAETLQRERRSDRAVRMTRALADSFSPDELHVLQQAAPLIERLAERL
jgi:DNA-binding MarR family transcriptional regulator